MSLLKVSLRICLIGIVLIELWLAFRMHRERDNLQARVLRGQNNSNAKQKKLEGIVAKNSALEANLQLLKTGRTKQTAGRSARADEPEAKKLIDRFKAALANPEFQRLLAENQMAGLEQRYGSLFKKLDLDAASIAKLKGLLVQRQMAKTDALLAAKDEGVMASNDIDGIREAAIMEAQANVDAQIHAILGDTGFAQYLHFEETREIRATVSQIQQALSYTHTPLSDEQADELTETWYQAMPESRKGRTSGPSAEWAAGLLPRQQSSDDGAPIPDSGIESAQSLLSPQQLVTVKHLISIQQARQRLGQMAASGKSN